MQYSVSSQVQVGETATCVILHEPFGSINQFHAILSNFVVWGFFFLENPMNFILHSLHVYSSLMYIL